METLQIEEIEKETETKDGKTVTVYEAEVRKPGEKKSRLKSTKTAGFVAEIFVSPFGGLVSTRVMTRSSI